MFFVAFLPQFIDPDAGEPRPADRRPRAPLHRSSRCSATRHVRRCSPGPPPSASAASVTPAPRPHQRRRDDRARRRRGPHRPPPGLTSGAGWRRLRAAAGYGCSMRGAVRGMLMCAGRGLRRRRAGGRDDGRARPDAEPGAPDDGRRDHAAPRRLAGPADRPAALQLGSRRRRPLRVRHAGRRGLRRPLARPAHRRRVRHARRRHGDGRASGRDVAGERRAVVHRPARGAHHARDLRALGHHAARHLEPADARHLRRRLRPRPRRPARHPRTQGLNHPDEPHHPARPDQRPTQARHRHPRRDHRLHHRRPDLRPSRTRALTSRPRQPQS